MITSNKQGRVTSVVCDDCHKLVPFTQPELSTNPDEATIIGHACPPQILQDTQDAIAEQVAEATAEQVV